MSQISISNKHMNLSFKKSNYEPCNAAEKRQKIDVVDVELV